MVWKGWFSSVQRRDAVTGAGESPYPPTETRAYDIAAVVVWQGGLGSWPHHSPGPGSGRQKSRFGRLIPSRRTNGTATATSCRKAQIPTNSAVRGGPGLGALSSKRSHEA